MKDDLQLYSASERKMSTVGVGLTDKSMTSSLLYSSLQFLKPFSGLKSEMPDGQDEDKCSLVKM